MGNFIGAICCLSLAVLFIAIGFIFALFKDRAAILISGFNSLPKEEREKFDKNKMSLDMKNSLFLWASVSLIGGILSYYINYYFAIIAGVIWLILFIKDAHFDTEKAFGKYRK